MDQPKKIINFLFILLFYSFTLFGETDFIFLTGGSASGKTSFAKKLIQKLGEEHTCCISLDEYLDKNVQPMEDFIRGMPNFDNPSMTNWTLLLQNITLLKEGKSIENPIYSFSVWTSIGSKTIDWKPIVIIEGIHATQSELDGIPGLRIFLDVTEEKRYKRRLQRDVKERGYSEEMIETTFFNMAVPYQKVFLDPTKHKANIIILDFDGESFCEKSINAVVNLFKNHKQLGFEKLKVKLQNKNEKLTIEPQDNFSQE